MTDFKIFLKDNVRKIVQTIPKILKISLTYHCCELRQIRARVYVTKKPDASKYRLSLKSTLICTM